MVASGRALFLAVLLLASAVPLAATTTKSVLAAQLDGVPPAASVRSEPAAVEAPTAGTQGAADWRSKVDASLLAAGDPAEVVTVFVASTDLAAVHRLLGRPVPSETASRLRVPVLEVPRFLLPKVAALPGILAVWPYHIPPQPTAPDDLYSPFRTSPDPQPAMRDVVAIQGASLAWADGFTGQGTRVLVMDTGVDFGHPDLNGTQARVTDLASPYFGWPIAFDSLSMNAWLFWGGAYPAANTWFADTNATDVDADANGTLDATGLNVTGIPSASGVFHYGQHPDQRLQNRVGANVTVLVTDSLAPGAYDTVYTDLDNDEDLSDEWPARRGDEVATRDVTGDGLADRSAGMVYFVADGVTPLPYSDVIAAEYLLPNRIPANGGLVAFAINDATESGGAHGTLCASAVVAQGVISGGVVTGMAPDAKIITTGNVYNGGNFLDYYFFAAEGYDGVPGTGDEAHILSGSFGDSWVVERGWEFEARLVDNITANYARELTFIIAAGNGGFGYGTVVTPGATPGVITAGAATSFRRPDGASYSTWGDVIPWSDRGPSPFGQLDPDVVSVGATASGDVTVNEAGNGNNAWGYWSGTSLATPVTAGAAALVHQAYRQARAANPEGLEMRDLLMSTADDLGYDVFVQGAGLVNASRATRAAAQVDGLWARPALWQAGGYRGQDPDAFASLLFPGDSDSVTFTLTNEDPLNATSVTVSDETYVRLDATPFTVVANTSREDGFQGGRPDYVIPLINRLNATAVIPGNAVHVRVSVKFDFDDFDANGDWIQDNRFTANLFDWWDTDGDGLYWNDSNADGVAQSGEFDGSEVAMTTYSSQLGNTLEVRIGNPWARIHDGLFLGSFHPSTTPLRPLTNVSVLVESFAKADDPWVTASPATVNVPAGGTAVLTATLTVPLGAGVGAYESALVLDAGGVRSTVPIAVNVAANGAEFAFGGPGETGLYRNGQLFGGHNWGWRYESGDWRYYLFDVPDTYAFDPDARLLASVSWDGTPTDVDAFLLGNQSSPFSTYDPARYGPYGMGIRDSGQTNYVGGGKFLFGTNTGGPQELFAADVGYGLNELVLHNVLNSGDAAVNQLRGQVGSLSTVPRPLDIGTVTDFSLLNSTTNLAVTSTVDLYGVNVRAFGVSIPQTLLGEVANQDIPFLPSSASWSRQLTIADGGLIEATSSSTAAVDLDLYLLRDVNGNGLPNWGTEIVASSLGPTAAERVQLKMPANGTYWVFAHGYDVPNGSDFFDITLDVIQGTTLAVNTQPSGPIANGGSLPFTVSYELPWAEGPAHGVLFLGPPQVPDALMVRFLAVVHDAQPEISGLLPIPGSLLSTNQPRIAANLSDPGSGLNFTAARLFLDGSDITSMCTVTAESIYWDPIFLLPDGLHVAEVYAEDQWGNANSTSWSFTVDTVPPFLLWTDPPDGLLTNQVVIPVAGFTEPTASLAVDGSPVSVAGNGTFQATRTLTEGPNILVVSATDAAGNTAQETRWVTLDTIPPPLAVYSLSDGDLVNSPVVILRGPTELGATVVAQGLVLAVNTSGYFSANIFLLEGPNTITVTATDAAGNTATLTLSVTLDTVPPPLTLASPADGLVTQTPVGTLAGTTEPGASLTVNGSPVTVGGTGLFVWPLTYIEGANVYTVIATDSAGNSATTTVIVTHDTIPPPLTVTSPVDGILLSAPPFDLVGWTEPGARVSARGAYLVVLPDGNFSAVLTAYEGANALQVVAEDPAGNVNSTWLTFTLDTRAPLADAGADREAEAGVTVTFDGSGSTDPSGIADHAWTITGPGGVWEVTGARVVRVFADPGIYTATLRVTDAAGNAATDFAVVVVHPAGDSDEDALPDTWEREHFGNLTEGPAGDPDVDGLTNLQEWKDGTDPLTAESSPPVAMDWTWLLLAVIVVLALLLAFSLLRRKKEPAATEPPPPSQEFLASLPPPETLEPSELPR